jgi:hypothetical protein
MSACRQLQPNDYTGLELNTNVTSWDDEVWAGNKVSLEGQPCFFRDLLTYLYI